ncbi:helix-turn-helix domain-containing protein [Carnobacterium maltaromaticum]|uniref:helix-turn-helix domain-containing protein n=1 Tax=Carnobacterium maltaromaticum TaxID=2751 RepID=UPI0039BE7E6F
MEKVKKGRKSKYDTHVAPRLQEIEWWCREGLTEIEICKRLDVAESTFNNYKREFSELMESLKKGKEIADYQVEDALYKRAIGYEYEEETRQLTDLGFTTTKIVTKHVSPDTGAIALWLKNRKRDSWQNTNTLDERLKQEQIKKAKAEAAILENAASKLSAGEETAKHIQSLIDIGKSLIGGEE